MRLVTWNCCRGAYARKAPLLPALLAYGAASLFHHFHNAEFLVDYPNLPAWLSRAGVYAAWLGVTAVGVAGYLLLRRGYERMGLAVLGGYGLLGLYGPRTTLLLRCPPIRRR